MVIFLPFSRLSSGINIPCNVHVDIPPNMNKEMTVSDMPGYILASVFP